MLTTPRGLTPTETRIWRILSDGQYHATADLKTALDDSMSSKNALEVAITFLRRKLGPLGLDIVNRRGLYRLLRTIGGDGD